MARLATNDQGSRSYGYSDSYSGSASVTKSYSLEEAIEGSGSGKFDPIAVYYQMPILMQEEVDRLSTKRFSKKFSAVTTSQQREVMQSLYKEMKEERERPAKPISVKDVLEMAKQGTIDDTKMYQLLPEELQKYMDAIAKSLNFANFSTANRNVRIQVVESVLTIIAENAQQRKAIEETRLKEKQCIMCGERLGVFDRLFGAKQHRKCTEWKE